MRRLLPILALVLILFPLTAAGVSAGEIEGTSTQPGPHLSAADMPAGGNARALDLRAAPDPRLGISEGWRDPAALWETHAGSDRVLFSWSAIEPHGQSSFDPDNAVEPAFLQAERASGQQVIGLIQFTPQWAARDPDQGERSVPNGLGDPDGPWSFFVRRLATYEKGRVSAWMIWNEMEFRPHDQGAGGSWTWGGSEAEYWQLLKDAYRAIKAADPDATVVFGATSYWVDAVNGRDQFAQRVLEVAQDDPEAAANNWFFDAIAMNLYRAPDDIYRVGFELRDILQTYGLDKPRWVTELNCMPFDDPDTPKMDDGQRCTLDEQAAFTVQAFAMALAGGWDRALWYQLADGYIWQQQEVWGLVRDDGSRRPAFDAYQVVTRYFSHAERVTFEPLRRSREYWGTPWPDDPRSFYPNWLVYQVALDRGSERVSVLWNDSNSPLRVSIPVQGASATLLDDRGHAQPISTRDGVYELDLLPASAHGPTDPSGYYYVGGPPLLVVQEGVAADAPVATPRLVG
jgi:hypothetical protein